MAGLYIHIPFCAKRCIYCDFFSNTDMGYKKRFLKAVIKEMALRKEYVSDPVMDTIYLGGGTPSQVSPKELNQLFTAIYTHFTISDNPEITLEVNPDDLTKEYIRDLADLPVNRISMGIQSFQDDELKFLNRRHTATQAIEAVKGLQEKGISNISIDLIYGLPGQTEKQWMDNVREALALQVPHISAYHLMYEEGTALYHLKEKGTIEIVEEEKSLWAFNYLIHTLEEAGIQQYEISNFARPGFISRHNSSYWTGKQYLGLGPSAHSFNGKQRNWNVASLQDYLEGIEKETPIIEGEILDTITSYNDVIITGLRTIWGIDLTRIQQIYGDKLLQYCLKEAKPFLEKGLLLLEDNTLKISREGIFLSDTIMSELLFVE